MWENKGKAKKRKGERKNEPANRMLKEPKIILFQAKFSGQKNQFKIGFSNRKGTELFKSGSKNRSGGNYSLE